MQIRGKDLEVLISSEEISKKVKQLADQIKKDFKGEKILAVGILKGSFIFFADLVRELGKNVYVDFMQVSSYKDGMESSGELTFIKDLSQDISNKNVLVVDDIIDTGYTLKKLVEILQKRNPKTLKTCVLLDKKERRKVNYTPDYVGFEIPDKFVVGYGLDWGEEGRTLRDIYCVLD